MRNPHFLRCSSRRQLCGLGLTLLFGLSLPSLLWNAEPAVTAEEEQLETPENAPLIVHEWGTFTSFSGADGVRLEFRPLASSDLPSFIYGAVGSAFSKRSLSAIQRLETPVTYFYTTVERDVEVSVDFPQGLLTEFYPPPHKILPAYLSSEQLPPGSLRADNSVDIWGESLPVKNGHANWGRVHLIPTSQLVPSITDLKLAARIARHVEQSIVPDAAGNPYTYARNTDSAIVQVRHATGTSYATPTPTASLFAPSVLQGDYFEKFLFYRGVGQFDLPLEMNSTDGRTMQIKNDSDFDLTGLFLVNLEQDQLRFTRLDRLAAHSTVDLTLPEQPSENTLSSQVVEALIASGLYPKEAESMVQTWQASWFQEVGTRLFYILPQPVTNTLLPLHVNPQPQELVRVMVGRLEFLTPDAETRMLKLVERSLQKAALTEGAEMDPLTTVALTEFGRFADPALTRIAIMATTSDLREHAEKLRQILRETTTEQ